MSEAYSIMIWWSKNIHRQSSLFFKSDLLPPSPNKANTRPCSETSRSSIVCIIFYLKPLQNFWPWERRSYKPSSLVSNVRGRNKVERACFFAFSAHMESLSAQQSNSSHCAGVEKGIIYLLMHHSVCVLLHTVINSYCPIALSYYRMKIYSISESTFPILNVYYELSQRKADDRKETSFVSFSIRRVEL